MLDWKLREVLVGSVIIASFASLLLVNVAQKYGTPFFGAEAGLFDAIMAVFTLLALIAGGIGAFLSYRAALKAIDATRIKDEWEQFRSGVQMLGASTDAETIAGIEILNHLGEKSAKTFELLIFNVLRSYANELSGDAKSTVWGPSGATLSRYPSNDAPEAPAFIALGGLAAQITARPERGPTLLRGRALVFNILLANRVVYGSSFRNLHVDRIALDKVVFRKCDFGNAMLAGRALSVTFEDCDLTNATIELYLSTQGSKPKFTNCKISGATMLGLPLNEWIVERGG